MDFRAFEIESLGAFGSGAHSLFNDIAFRIRALRGSAGARALLYRQIAAAIQLGNAACILEALSRGR